MDDFVVVGKKTSLSYSDWGAMRIQEKGEPYVRCSHLSTYAESNFKLVESKALPTRPYTYSSPTSTYGDALYYVP